LLPQSAFCPARPSRCSNSSAIPPSECGAGLQLQPVQHTGCGVLCCAGPSICGQCVKYRGVGQGLGGNPITGDWQLGFICDSCPECSFGDIDLQKGGDGRWKVEW
jgi:hypothetical protein